MVISRTLLKTGVRLAQFEIDRDRALGTTTEEVSAEQTLQAIAARPGRNEGSPRIHHVATDLIFARYFDSCEKQGFQFIAHTRQPGVENMSRGERGVADSMVSSYFYRGS